MNCIAMSLSHLLNWHFSFPIARSTPRAETNHSAQTSNGANEANTNSNSSSTLELGLPPTENFVTIAELVRASIIDTKGHSEPEVHYNISAAKQWNRIMHNPSRYSEDRDLTVWRIKIYLRDNYGYVMAGLSNPQNPTEKS